MNEYEFRAINLIAEAFEKRIILRYISTDNDNDIGVRIFGLISNTTEEKRSRLIEACK